MGTTAHQVFMNANFARAEFLAVIGTALGKKFYSPEMVKSDGRVYRQWSKIIENGSGEACKVWGTAFPDDRGQLVADSGSGGIQRASYSEAYHFLVWLAENGWLSETDLRLTSRRATLADRVAEKTKKYEGQTYLG